MRVPMRFTEAAASYGRAYEVARASGSPDAYYPAINGAYLALLAGHEEEAASRSAEVLQILGDRIEAARDGDPPDRYWVLATAIEAYLLTGRYRGCTGIGAAGRCRLGQQSIESLFYLAAAGTNTSRQVAATGNPGRHDTSEGGALSGPHHRTAWPARPISPPRRRRR